MSFLIDTHAHLDFPELFSRLDQVLKNAKENNILRIITISTNLEKIEKIINISHQHPEIFFSVGVHPNEVLKDKNYSNYEMMINITKNSKCVGIGECGLDYHFGNENKTIQKLSFVTQINLARDTGLPLIIHSRDADDDMIEILQKEYKNGEFKVISFFAKKARGLFTRYLIKENITKIDELKLFTGGGYSFSEMHDNGNMIFTR